MSKLVALFFLAVGIVFFLVMTSFLSNTSETALMNGSMGLVPGFLGFVGAMIGRRTVTRAVVFGLLFTILASALLVSFFQVVWPRL
jgi:hypothetical protein